MFSTFWNLEKKVRFFLFDISEWTGYDLRHLITALTLLMKQINAGKKREWHEKLMAEIDEEIPRVSPDYWGNEDDLY